MTKVLESQSESETLERSDRLYAWKVPASGHYELTLSSIEAQWSEEATDVFEDRDEDDVSIVCWEEEDTQDDRCDSCREDSDLDLFLGDGALNLCDDCNEMLQLTFADVEDDTERGIGR